MLAINPIISLRGFNPLLRKYFDGLIYISNILSETNSVISSEQFIGYLKQGFGCNDINIFLKNVKKVVKNKNAKEFVDLINEQINIAISNADISQFSNYLFSNYELILNLLKKVKDYRLRQLMIDVYKCMVKIEYENLEYTSNILSSNPFKVLFTFTSPIEYKTLNNSLVFHFEPEANENQISINSISINRVKNKVYCEVLYNFQVSYQTIYARGLVDIYNYQINL